MIVYEIAILVGLFVVAIVAIMKGGKPLAEAYSEKLKNQYRDMGSEKEQELEKKIGEIETEVMDLREEVRQLRETVDFASGLAESKEESGTVINTKTTDRAEIRKSKGR